MHDVLLIGGFLAACLVINWLAIEFDIWRWSWWQDRRERRARDASSMADEHGPTER